MSRLSMNDQREKCYKELLEELEYEILETIGFDFEIELPYRHIRKFCEKQVPQATRDTVYDLAFKFCNDSFKLPACLYFHPKIIAASCIQMAGKWRLNNKIDCGFELKIKGHPWFKWVDSAIEQPHIKEVIEYLRVLYQKEAPKVPPTPPQQSVEISSNV